MIDEQEVVEGPITPQPGPQTVLAECSADVVFFGGQAGGGKSFGLLLEPLYDIHNPGFGAVIFRRTTKQITNEGGLWDTAQDLYGRIAGVTFNGNLYVDFPAGSRITFAHMEHEKNRYDWQGSQIPLICFDELTHFTWKQFNYMLSRNRSTCGAKSRVRATLNPDPDHWVRNWIDWYIGEDGLAISERSGVIRYFVILGDEVHWGDTKQELLDRFQEINPPIIPKSFTFIESKLSDNKILMEKDPSYLASLQALTRVERARLLGGNWNVRATAGAYFKRSDFTIVDAAAVPKKQVRAWDQAGTKKKKESDHPDWTVGVKMSLGDDGYYYVEHVERFQEDPPTVDKKIVNIATSDKVKCVVRIAQDPGQAGKSQRFSQTRQLAGFTVVALTVSGDKETRAKPFATQVQAGNVRLVKGIWNEAYLNELENFPEGNNDDQVDASSDAFDSLLTKKEAGVW